MFYQGAFQRTPLNFPSSLTFYLGTESYWWLLTAQGVSCRIRVTLVGGFQLRPLHQALAGKDCAVQGRKEETRWPELDPCDLMVKEEGTVLLVHTRQGFGISLPEGEPQRVSPTTRRVISQPGPAPPPDPPTCGGPP